MTFDQTQPTRWQRLKAAWKSPDGLSIFVQTPSPGMLINMPGSCWRVTDISANNTIEGVHQVQLTMIDAKDFDARYNTAAYVPSTKS